MAARNRGARILAGLLLTISVLATLTYLVDYVVLRVKVARDANPFGTVTVKPFYAVPQKNHKVEFLFGDPEDQTCVYSLFPHLGDSPCWYLERHKTRRVDM